MIAVKRGQNCFNKLYITKPKTIIMVGQARYRNSKSASDCGRSTLNKNLMTNTKGKRW